MMHGRYLKYNKNSMYSNSDNLTKLPILPENAQTLILILGQCTLPTGEPHPWLIDRVNTAYELLQKYDLNLETTYFIVSGSDVSNREYGIVEEKKRHPSQAFFMGKLLGEIDRKVRGQGQQKGENGIKFSDHVLIQDQANTTIQNFYYTFHIITRNKTPQKITKIFLVTSDFHLKRSKYVFDTLFFNKAQQAQLLGNSKTFNYEKQVIFVASPSKWEDQGERARKFQKEERLYNAGWLIEETVRTAERLWGEVCGGKGK